MSVLSCINAIAYHEARLYSVGDDCSVKIITSHPSLNVVHSFIVENDSTRIATFDNMLYVGVRGVGVRGFDVRVRMHVVVSLLK